MVNHEGSMTAVDVLDDDGWDLVVTQADPTVMVSDELLRYLTRPHMRSKRGSASLDGDLLAIGTPGKGMGRLTYRLTARGEGWYLAEQESMSNIDEPGTEITS
jgi:hypothetical protein